MCVCVCVCLCLYMCVCVYVCGCIRYHPDHEVGVERDPERGGQEAEQVPALPARQAAVGDGEVEQDAEGPGEEPPQPQTHTL